MRIGWGVFVSMGLSLGLACAPGPAPAPAPGPTAAAAPTAEPTAAVAPRSAPGTAPKPAAAPARPSPSPATPTRITEATRSAAVAAAVEALPVIARIDDLAPTPFVLRGRLSPKRARAMTRMARAVVADVARRFVGPAVDDPHAVVDVCLFESDEPYAALATLTGDRDSMMGFYLPTERLILANLGRGVGNLRHELVHPLVGDDFRSRGLRIPAWFNEGLGSLYGTARARRSKVTFLVNYRLRHVRAALRGKRLPTLADMASSGRRELYGARSGTFYGTARYLLLYLDASGELEAFYRAMTAAEPTAERQLAALSARIDRQRFIRWTRRLRKGRTAPKPR